LSLDAATDPQMPPAVQSSGRRIWIKLMVKYYADVALVAATLDAKHKSDSGAVEQLAGHIA
jgi:hypothetical protein